MFGKRSDGRRVKKVEPFERIIPYIMKHRYDSMNMMNDDCDCEPIDEYIKKRREDGVHITYMHILIAAMVRTIALRPQLNRFVINSKLYTRDKIYVSFVVQKNLRDDSAGTTVKIAFEGTETLDEIAKKIDDTIASVAFVGSESKTDTLANTIMSLPDWLIRITVNTLMWMDKHNMLPKAVIEASPFHTTFFVTNLKSISINYIYHHVYEFGTTGLFMAFGKEKRIASAERDGTIKSKRILRLGLVSDERFCDGLYYAKSLHIFRRCMKDPSSMEIALEKRVEDCE